MTLSEGQILTYNCEFRDQISNFRAENTGKIASFKVKNNTQITSEHLQNNFQKVKKTTFLDPKMAKSRIPILTKV